MRLSAEAKLEVIHFLLIASHYFTMREKVLHGILKKLLYKSLKMAELNFPVLT